MNKHKFNDYIRRLTVAKVVGLEAPSAIAAACVVHLSKSVLPEISWWPGTHCMAATKHARFV